MIGPHEAAEWAVAKAEELTAENARLHALKINVLVVEKPSKNGSGETQCRVYSEDRREEFLAEFSRLTKVAPKVWVTAWATEIDRERPWFFEAQRQMEGIA